VAATGEHVDVVLTSAGGANAQCAFTAIIVVIPNELRDSGALEFFSCKEL